MPSQIARQAFLVMLSSVAASAYASQVDTANASDTTVADTAVSQVADNADAIVTNDVENRTWVDKKHAQTKDWLGRTADSVDGWFGKQNPKDPARLSLRVMMDTTWNEYDGTSIKPRIRAKVKLPTLEDRLSIMIGDDTLDYEQTGEGVHNDERVNTPYEKDKRFDSRQTREDNSSLAVRWSKFRKNTGIDVDVGLRSDDLFVRARYKKDWQFANDYFARFEQMYRYGSQSEHTALTTFTVGQPQSDTRTIANRTRLYYTHDGDEDIEWGNSLYQEHLWPSRLGERTLSYGIYTGGNIEDKQAHLNTYGPYVSYRQPVWRDWLFLQGDASYYNNKTEDRDHHVSLFGRVEVVF
ncbi:hypothetical protein [uncultured Moraxella sp.]|uniref:hypothetical protein n=1 Tax=uncultured Moraxella sp. TaxID=263769 RepID=UPI0025CCF353|nr:hypothetical protein [uncultured Moraxella sp.]